MAKEAVIGAIGAIFSFAGLIAAFRAPENPLVLLAASIVVLSFGVFLIGYVIWIFHVRPEVDCLFLGYRNRYLDPAGHVVVVQRKAQYRFNVNGVTSLWAQHLATTGRYENFQSNIGTIKVLPSGGAYKVRVDFDHPFSKGDEFIWVLNYEMHDALNGDDSLSVWSNLDVRRTELAVEFHQELFPEKVRCESVVDGKISVKEEPLIPTKEMPEVVWNFVPKKGAEYALHWTIPKAEWARYTEPDPLTKSGEEWS